MNKEKKISDNVGQSFLKGFSEAITRKKKSIEDCIPKSPLKSPRLKWLIQQGIFRSKNMRSDWHREDGTPSLYMRSRINTGQARWQMRETLYYGYQTFEDGNFAHCHHPANKIGSSPYIVTEGPQKENEVFDFYQALLFNPKLSDKKPAAFVRMGIPGKNGDYYDYLQSQRYLAPLTEETDPKPSTIEVESQETKEDKSQSKFFKKNHMSVSLSDEKSSSAKNITVFTIPIPDSSNFSVVLGDPKPTKEEPYPIHAEQIYQVYKLSEQGPIVSQCRRGANNDSSLAFTFLMVDYHDIIFQSDDPLREILILYTYVCSYQPCTQLSAKQFFQAIRNAARLHEYEEQLKVEQHPDKLKNRSDLPSFKDIETQVCPVAKEIIVDSFTVKDAISRDFEKNAADYCQSLALKLKQQVEIKEEVFSEPGKKEKHVFLNAAQELLNKADHLEEIKGNEKNLLTALWFLRPLLDATITPEGTEHPHFKDQWPNCSNMIAIAYALPTYSFEEYQPQCDGLIQIAQELKPSNPELTALIKESAHAFERMFYTVTILGNEYGKDPQPLLRETSKITQKPRIIALLKALGGISTAINEYQNQIASFSIEKLKIVANLKRAIQYFVPELQSYSSQNININLEEEIQDKLLPRLKPLCEIDPSFLESIQTEENRIYLTNLLNLVKIEEKTTPVSPLGTTHFTEKKSLPLKTLIGRGSNPPKTPTPTPTAPPKLPIEEKIKIDAIPITDKDIKEKKSESNSKEKNDKDSALNAPLAPQAVNLSNNISNPPPPPNLSRNAILTGVLLPWAAECGFSALPLGIPGLSMIELDQIRILAALLVYSFCLWPQKNQPQWVKNAILLGAVMSMLYLAFTVARNSFNSSISHAAALGLTMTVGAMILGMYSLFVSFPQEKRTTYFWNSFKNGLQPLLLLVLPLVGSIAMNRLLQNFAAANLEILQSAIWGPDLGLSLGTALGLCAWAGIFHFRYQPPPPTQSTSEANPGPGPTHQDQPKQG